MTFEPDQTVYLPDGREAIYVLNYFDTHLVRVVYHYEGGYDEPPYSYPEDKITHAARVFAKPPAEVYDKEILKLRGEVERLREEAVAARNEIADAAKNKAEMEKAAAKYPCIQQALDFIEGRITHVVKWSGYGAVTIHTMPEAFEQIDTWGGRSTHEGMKLLSLFGTDERGRKVGWGLNQYRDGSGSSTETIWPAKSEAEARAKVEELLNAAFAAWRSGDEKWWHGQIGVDQTLRENPWFIAPDDWLKHIAEREAEHRAAKIAKLREEIEKLETGK